ncbi:MAG: hypothetical protein HKN17_11170, partial [Rhodothermales bacterium]|nr:hypothetical protein [Rhodothermales bacterium]
MVLLFYGELPDERVADVRARLSVCSSCRDVLTGLEAIGEAVPRRSTVQIEDDALEAIRRSTAGKLRRYGREAESNRRGAWSGLFLRPALAGPAIALLAVIAFMIGFFMRPDLDVFPQTASTVQDLMYVSDISMNDDGTLAVTYAAASEETVRGTLDDPLIQRLLGRALIDGTDPVTRLRAANVIADIETGGSMRTDPDLTFALATVLAEENNTGLRLQAMQAAANLHP